MWKLYFGPNTCALAVQIALEEAGVRHEPVRLDMKQQQQRSAEYLALNPKGRVPALVTERGVLTEVPAILAYIAQAHPQAGLAPLDDPFEFARLQSFNSYLCSTVHPAHAHRVRGARWADDPAAQEAMKRKVPQNMTDCFTLIEQHCLVGPWVMGERYSVADGYLHTIARWLEGDGVDVARFPKVADHTRRMSERPAVQRALATHA